MTAFALPIWLFGKTERVQELALLSLAFIVPAIIMSPIAGTIVDRSNRKTMMIISDLAAGLTTIIILILLSTNSLETWHLYVTTAINGAFYTFQWPAYSSTITIMVPKKHYGRADGLTSLARTGAEIFSPVLAGSSLGFIGLQGILLIDIATFLFAIVMLLIIQIPQPAHTPEGAKAQGDLWQEASYGFQYILNRPGLLGLQSVFLICNFLHSLAFTALAAMILFRTGQDAQVFAWVSSAGAVGGLGLVNERLGRSKSTCPWRSDQLGDRGYIRNNGSGDRADLANLGGKSFLLLVPRTDHERVESSHLAI